MLKTSVAWTAHKLHSAAVLFILLLFASGVYSAPNPAKPPEHYPTKPIRIIVSAGPGGGMDILARLLAPKLSLSLGQTVIVENRPGAGGNIGIDLVAKSTPDGHTLALAYMSLLVVNPSLYPKMPFDVLKDLAPVAFVASISTVLVIHPSVPAQSVQELIALYKSKPGEYNYSSAGDGTGPHLAAELLKTLAGIDLVNISYNGSGPALVGVLSGQTSLMFNTMVQSRPLVEAGKLRALAVTSSKRSSAMPELPTLSEAGVTGFEMDGWFGLVAPAATPKAIIEQLNLEVRRVLASAEIAERLTKLGSEPSAIVTPEQFGNYIQAELTKWAKVVKAAGMRLPE